MKMKKEILVFIFNGYADWEPAYVCAELNSSDTDYFGWWERMGRTEKQ